MLEEEVKAISTAAHKDLELLLKEYARAGYKQAQGGTGKGFDALWHNTFHADEDEETPTNGLNFP